MGRGSRIRVMIVDDHPLVRSAVAGAIASDAVEVVAEAATAEEALAIAPAIAPDVMLVDISLPGMSGVQLVRELAPRMPATKIVMLTVSSADRDLVEAMRYGAAGYLTKDVTPEALARSVLATQNDELVMSRQLAARLVDRLSRRARPTGSDDGPSIEQLSQRELDVLRLLADHLTDREIAAALTISVRTVETHVSNIIHKLGARNRSEAAQRYRRED
jgi:two-component system, NarL family, nitrate/nitrite response regulator NarL